MGTVWKTDLMEKTYITSLTDRRVFTETYITIEYTKTTN